MDRATPLILDTFEKVQVGKRSGSYDPEAETWVGDSQDVAEQVMSRQTHHRGEDH